MNQRGIAFVAYTDSDTAPSDFWWPAWILWLIGGVAALALLLHLFRWLDSDDDVQQRPTTSNRSTNGNRRGSTGDTNGNGSSRKPTANGNESSDNESESSERNQGSVPPVFDPSSERSSGSDQAGSSVGSEITVNVYGEFHGDQNIYG